MPEMLYLVSLRDDAADRTVQFHWSIDRIERSLRWLRYRNTRGCRIHGRPWASRHLLVDDLTPDALDKLAATYVPAAVVETSSGSLQAWVTISPVPVPQPLASCVARLLARKFGGDQGAANAHQPGGWPSFTNRKEIYKTEGRFPFTRLIYADGPIVTPNAREILAEAADLLASRKQAPNSKDHRSGLRQSLRPKSSADEMADAEERIRASLPPAAPLDRSRLDFAVVRRLLERGATPKQAADVIANSEKARLMASGRAQDYVRRTVNAAQNAERGREAQRRNPQ